MPCRCLPLLLFVTACAAPRVEPPAPPRVPGLQAPIVLPADWPRGKAGEVGADFVLDRDAGGGPTVRWVEVSNGARERSRAMPPLLPASGAGAAPARFDRPPAACVLGDFDGDGKDELCVQTGNTTAAICTGESLRTLAQGAPLPDEPEPRRWFAGRAFDWTGDGKADVAFARGSDVCLLTEGAASTNGQLLLRLAEDERPAMAEILGTAADWDRDGDVDLALAIRERGIVWCRNDGTTSAPVFTRPLPLWPAPPLELTTLLLAHDLDDDGWPDLLVGSTTRTPTTPDHYVRQRRADLTGFERAELARLQLELLEIDQRRARIARGLEPADPDPRFGSSFGGTDEHRRENLRKAIGRLQWEQVPVQQNPMRCHFRQR